MSDSADGNGSDVLAALLCTVCPNSSPSRGVDPMEARVRPGESGLKGTGVDEILDGATLKSICIFSILF